MHRGRDLVTHRTLRNIEVRHRDHIFDASHGITWRIGVDGSERPFMARVHGLQHVEGLFATHLANHDAVGTHTQTIDDQLPLPHCALAFDVRRACFQAYDVLLLKLQFGGVFNGNDAIGVGNVSRQNIQQRCFAGARSSGHQNVKPAFDHGRKQFQHRLGESHVLDHLARGNRLASKTPDGQAGPVNGQRGNNCVHARSVGQAGVDHGRRFIDSASDARDDALNDLHQMRIVFER